MADGAQGTVTVQDHCVVNYSKKHNRILSAHRNVGFSHKLSLSFKQRSIKVTTRSGFKLFEWLLSSLSVRIFPVLLYLVKRDSHFRIQNRATPIWS